MAITIDNTSVKSDVVSVVTSTSFSHTVSGSDRVLIVYVYQNNTKNNPSSVTYNGKSLTMIQSVAPIKSDNLNNSIWYLIAPDTGSNTVAVSFGASTYARVVATSFNGANDVKNGTSNNIYSGYNSISLTIPSSMDNVCIMLCGTGNGSQSPTSGAGQTDEYNSGNVSFATVVASHKTSSSPNTSMSYYQSSYVTELCACGAEIVAGNQSPPSSSKFFQLF